MMVMIITSSCLTYGPGDDPAAPVFVDRRCRLRVGFTRREALHHKWRWCLIGAGAVWISVYFELSECKIKHEARAWNLAARRLFVCVL